MLNFAKLLQTCLEWAAIGTTLAAIFAGGCNTMEGAGRDVERAGESIQDAAD